MTHKPMKHLLPLLLLFAAGCTVSRNYDPARKFGPKDLQEDYSLFRKMLEEAHPSLYWYTPKDSVDYYFAQGATKLTDSMPEYKFRNVLSYVLAKIRCGHTTVRQSKEAVKYSERTRAMLFPLNIKAWEDTVVVTSNLSRRDSNVQRGVLLKSIDGRPIQTIVDTFFQHFSADGYNMSHKYQTISNNGVFRTMYAYIYGLKLRTPIEYIDTTGHLRSTVISLNSLVADSPRRVVTVVTPPQPTKRQRRQMSRQSMRSLRIDTSLHTAFMEVNSFSKGNGLRRFFRTSFHTMRKEKITNLVVDMRGNGGGSVSLSNLLTKYIADQPFKIADSLYAITNKSKYKQYRNNYLLYRLLFLFMTHKKKDGLYHFTYFENLYFQPKTRYHFLGNTYILTGGNTFSAAALFTKALVNQEDVLVVGEETGGGSYGNTAWLIPDATLPHTHVRFRLPLFRLIIDRNETKGHGIFPEVEVKPTVADIRRNADVKMERVIELIRARAKG
jgi:hypothetical protein